MIIHSWKIFQGKNSRDDGHGKDGGNGTCNHIHIAHRNSLRWERKSFRATSSAGKGDEPFNGYNWEKFVFLVLGMGGRNCFFRPNIHDRQGTISTISLGRHQGIEPTNTTMISIKITLTWSQPADVCHITRGNPRCNRNAECKSAQTPAVEDPRARRMKHRMFRKLIRGTTPTICALSRYRHRLLLTTTMA